MDEHRVEQGVWSPSVKHECARRVPAASPKKSSEKLVSDFLRGGFYLTLADSTVCMRDSGRKADYESVSDLFFRVSDVVRRDLSSREGVVLWARLRENHEQFWKS